MLNVERNNKTKLYSFSENLFVLRLIAIEDFSTMVI